MENLIYLVSAFDVHARLRDHLQDCLQRAVAQGRILPSNCA